MPNASSPSQDLLSYLEFHVASGADAVLDERPHDRFAEADAAPPRAEAPPREAASQKAPPRDASDALPHPPARVPELAREAPRETPPAPRPSGGRTYGRSVAAAPEEAAGEARERARNAETLADLERLLRDFDGCALKFSAKTLVFADGDPGAKVMFVGEMPGADEDRVGKPFMGRSGQLLERMLATIGLERGAVYIANIVPWRPPGNRSPTPQEIAICKPFIERQIELADPDVLVCLGGPATQTLTGTKDGILKARGRWFPYKTGRREIRALATLHPAYLLRQPLQKRLAWRDFRALKAALAGD